MTPPATEPAEAATPTPRVCTCGYDLAGLPASAGAKCPECGAGIGARKSRLRRGLLFGLLALVALAPTPLFIAVVEIGTRFVWADRPIDGVRFAALAASAWFVLVSLPACAFFAFTRVPNESTRHRWIFAALMVFLGAIANATVFLVVMLAFDT